MRNLIYLLVVFICVSCGGGISDSHQNLGEGYFYLGEGALSNFIYFSKNTKEPTIDEIIVYQNVKDYVNNELYVFVLQEANQKSIADWLNFSHDYSEKKIDSLFKFNNNFRKILENDKNYYIIDKVAKKKYGPLSKKEFYSLKNELNIFDKIDF